MKKDIPNLPTTAFLTQSELRKRWKVSGMFLWRLRRDNKMPSYRIGPRGVRFAVEDVLKFETQSVS